MAKSKQADSAAAKKTDAPNQATVRFTLTPGDRSVLTFASAFVLLRLVASSMSAGAFGVWGLNFASYLPMSWDIIVLLAVPLLLLIPQLRNAVAGVLAQDAQRGANSAVRLVAAFVLTVGLAILAWEYQVAYAFLGDGAYYATEIFRIAADASYKTALIKPTSWLTGHFIHWLSVTFQPENVRWPFQMVGVIGMVLVAGGSVLLTRKEKRSAALLLVSAMLLGAGSLMFFGYIELYALSYAFTVLFLLASYASLRHGATVVVPGLLLLAAIAFGASAAVFVPAYLLLLHWRVRGEGGAFPLKRAAIILSLLPLAGVALLYIVLGAGSYNPYVLSILPAELVEKGIVQGTQQYTLFSAIHLVDVGNILFLNGGVFIIPLLPLLFLLRKSLRWSAPEMLFALTVASAALLLVIAGNTTLGLTRDWDLMTVPVAGLVFAMCVVLIQAHSARALALPLLIPMLALASLGGAYAWVRVNLDEPASAARLDHALQRSKDAVLPINTYVGLENLRKYYYSLKDREQLRQILRRMVETGIQKVDSYSKMQTMIFESKDQQARIHDFEWLFERYLSEYKTPPPPKSAAYIEARTLRESVTKALLIGLQTGDVEVMSTYLSKLRELVPDWKEAGLIDAYLTPNTTIDQIAAQAKEAIGESTEDAALLMAAARVQKQAAQYSEAAKYYRLALRRDARTFPIVYIELAQVLIEELGRTEEGVRVLNDCLGTVPNAPEAAQAREILTRLGF